MIRIIVVVILWISSVTFAQTSSDNFATANKLYTEGKYKLAIDSYKKILENKENSSALYHNLGNCYYKLNAVASAIYNYEKALKLNPENKDAQINLIIAKKLSLDRIEPLPQTFIDKLNLFFGKISYNKWGILAILGSFLTAIFFLAYYYAEQTSRKKVFFTINIVSIILTITTFSIAYQQFKKKTKTKYGIIFSTEISVKNEPTETANESFKLHEGTKVKLLDAVDIWKKISIADGKTGWIKSNSLKEI